MLNTTITDQDGAWPNFDRWDFQLSPYHSVWLHNIADTSLHIRFIRTVYSLRRRAFSFYTEFSSMKKRKTDRAYEQAVEYDILLHTNGRSVAALMCVTSFYCQPYSLQ